MAAWLWQRVCCCLTGHDYVIASERSRIFLRCRTCGRTSHGLELSENPHPSQSRTGQTTLPGARAAAGRSHFATR
jgi:hypothetical protein